MSGNDVPFYHQTYGRFQLGARERVRQETYGEDLGQNSWLTVEEWRTFAEWLGLSAGMQVLDVGCGSGGPALYLMKSYGVRITGADQNPSGIATATDLADQQGLGAQARFLVADASQPLPLADGEFDAVVCIDAVNHLPGRAAVLAEWHRLLKPGGRLLFTDPVVVTGLVSSEEIAARSSIGYFLFSPAGADERLLQEAGFEVLRQEDLTQGVADIAGRWFEARARYRDELLADEGAPSFEGTQRFLAMVRTLAGERRLSRHAFLAQR